MLRGIIAERLGTTADDPRPQLLAGTVVTIMDVVYRQWISSQTQVDMVKLIDEAFDCFANLMTPPKTEQRTATTRRDHR